MSGVMGEGNALWVLYSSQVRKEGRVVRGMEEEVGAL